MTVSLRRSLAVRFAATMAAGLLLATGAFYWAATRALAQPVSSATLQAELLVALLAVVICGTAATLVGAWHFTSSAVRPVAEITSQATRIEAGTLDQRILAHADTEEYVGLVGVLNRMLERLERGFATQRRFTADMSHELRTPLTALQGEIEVALRADRSPREYQLVLRSALEEIDRLTELCEDLLLVTRADAHLVQAQRSPTDVETLVGGVLEGMRRRLEEREIVLRRAFAVGHAPVSIDQELFRRMLHHLLDNAVRYAPIGGVVGVIVELDDPGILRVAVENSGLGIPATDLPHLFEPFFRGDWARTRSADGGGTGLGLALVDTIARLHGGMARASSAPGRMTRFEVDLAVPLTN